MITRSDKEEIIAKLKGDLEAANGIFLTNLVGMESNDAVALRKKVRDVKGKLVVTRNTLFEKAAIGTYAESLLKDLKGPNAVAFSYEDQAAVAKCLKEASKDQEMVSLGGGFLGEEQLSEAKVIELAELPSRDEMLGTTLATFMAPISAFARVLHSINEKKGEGAEAVEAAPAAETAEATEE
jgi:large subunit ribosomal protein L10